ncbi:FctA domain-containing protein [Streptococcus sp. GP0011]|uniref:Spy0128 family protein n=1 Tax=Streptococcus sp. GP0011 TaxID=3063751 RepID=UPI0026E13EB3|nr:FctA domain-containing protein [Streptococcus sp. GP0011]MDO6346434.1 FctA domain-containing protein [Streptococcus sp. GP0011]
MKKRTSKLFHGLMALLLVVSVFLPALRLNGVVSAAEKTESEYTLTTEPTINTNRLVDHAKYGEGKFYLKTTYAFPDNVTLNNGDFMVYHVPNEFKIEVDSTTDLKAPNGDTIATLTTEKATNTAKITVTNEEYFKKFNENKQIVASFTVVWADHVEKNKEYEINIPGAGVYHLTRIVPDVDPTGFTKWGVQDSDDPNYVNWRIRVNRYAKSYTGVNIQDTIPDGQVLASEITGYYFPDWENGYGRTKLDSAHVQVTDKNHFSITPNGDGTLDHKGLFILYRTRLTKPVDQVTKRVLNNVSVTTNEEAQPIDFEGFAPITTTDGIGGGAKSDEVAIEVTKKLEGKALEKDAFSFQLLDDKGNVLQTVKNDENGKVKFEAIKYKEAGTFKYTIKEVNDNKPGYTYDANVLKATVTVEDVLGEKLASVKFEDSKKEFTNTYAAKEAKLQLEAKKVLNGKAIEAGQFEFELKENGAVLHTVSNDANGKIQFPELKFTQEETRTFTISEKAGDVAGVEYDPNAYEVKVVVKDNGQGQLVATPDTKNITFTNVYKAKPAKPIIITATKVLNGKELEADKYEFELKEKESDKVVATAKNAADGTVTFKEIEFATAGDYTYTITEKAGSEKGVTYDTAKHEVKVKVTDNGQGQLEAAVTGDNPTFTNTYKAATTSATITATKVLEGKALEAGKYEFELKEGDKVIGTATNAADGTVTFEDITYTAAGNHTYTITEKAGSEKGVTYDTAKHEVKVAVTDNGAGQLVATVTDNNPTFTNTYKAASAKATITAKKVLNGKALEAGKYEFELKEGEKVVATATNAADGTVTFEDITYTAAGDHTYTITEKAGSEAGVTYDESTHKVTVKVTDNGAGQLVATATNNNPTFTNTYKAAETKATITATKVLEGKALEAGKYEFELKEGDKVVATAKNAADGTVTFEDIKYAAAGNHTYTISEKAGSEAGVTYDTAKHEVKVAVTDNGQGQLVATVTDNNPTFTNTYKAASTTVNITAKKVLEGKALEAGKYEFELKEGNKVIGTATNAADGTVAFEAIKYAAAGEHTYTISEKAGSEAGVTYDKSTHNVTVNVTDNGAGQLVATVTDNNPTFTNTYVASSTQVTFTAKKVLNGDKELVKDQFKFELKEGDKVIGTATNAADGTVTFTAIEYKEAGEHTYTITEVKGNDENIKYDENSYKVTVTVTDNGAGKLVTTVTGNNPTITNTYTAPSEEKPKEDPKGEQPKRDLPNTGGADFTVFSTILGLVLAALAGLVYRAKKVD